MNTSMGKAKEVKSPNQQRAASIVSLIHTLTQDPKVTKEPLVVQEEIINSAVAISIGNFLMIPTTTGMIPRQYYVMNEENSVNEIVSLVNESVMINYKKIIPMVFPVWFTRYTITTGQAGLILLSEIMKNSIACSKEDRDAHDKLNDVLED